MKDHAVIVLRDGDQVLFVQRSATKKSLPNIWALASGTVEEGETVEQTAIREAKEELGIEIAITSELVVLEMPEYDAKLHFLNCVATTDEPIVFDPGEIQAVKWATCKDFFQEYPEAQLIKGLKYLRDHPVLWHAEPRHAFLANTVLIFKDGKVLMGLRLGDKLTEGMYGTPGGRMEYQESFLDSVQREIAEEVAIEIANVRFIGLVNVRALPPRHVVVAVFVADWKSGEPRTCEPDRCAGWEWIDLENLPASMTPGTKYGIEAYKTGQMLFESEKI